MTDKHPADVLADKCALIGSNHALWSQQAATMLRRIPALEASLASCVESSRLADEAVSETLKSLEAERDNVRSINARISEEMGQLRAELAALKAQAAQHTGRWAGKVLTMEERQRVDLKLPVVWAGEPTPGAYLYEGAAPQAAQPLTFAEVMGEMGIGKEGADADR